MSYHVDVSNNGGYVFESRSKEYSFSIDMKGASGVTPPDCLLASVASCLGVYIRKYVEGAKIDLPVFCVSADAELTKDPPLRFKEVTITVDCKGLVLDERRKAALLEFIKNCPVHNTMQGHPEIVVSLL